MCKPLIKVTFMNEEEMTPMIIRVSDVLSAIEDEVGHTLILFHDPSTDCQMSMTVRESIDEIISQL